MRFSLFESLSLAWEVWHTKRSVRRGRLHLAWPGSIGGSFPVLRSLTSQEPGVRPVSNLGHTHGDTEILKLRGGTVCGDPKGAICSFFGVCARRVCEAPLIFVAPQFLERDLCSELIRAAQKHGKAVPIFGEDVKYDMPTWPERSDLSPALSEALESIYRTMVQGWQVELMWLELLQKRFKEGAIRVSCDL